MTTTETPTPEPEAALPDFDPAQITEELVGSLTVERLRQVIEHYKLPAPPRGASKADLQALARVAVLAHRPVAELPAPELPDAPADPVHLEPVPHEIIPAASRWAQIVSMAEYLARAQLTPAALRSKPHDVATVLLGANDLGIPITQALNKLIVIDGKLSMAAELMVALALRDGHSIKPDPANDATIAIAHCRRQGEDEVVTITYTIDEAVKAGLCSVDQEGKVRARSGQGKILPWEKHTPDMLWARCVSRAARRCFPDCLAGVSYTPDELGYIEAEAADEPHAGGRHGDATVTLHQQQANIAARIAELPEQDRDALREAWKRRGFPGPANLRPAAIRGALELLEEHERLAQARQEAADAEIPDAELVESPTAAEGDAGSAGEPAPDNAVDTAAVPASGESETRIGTAEEEPLAPASPADTGELTCQGCGEPITPDVTPTWDDEDQPWHVECSPFV